ncbi:MAG: SLATT domain-containing protein [Actinobacteria bacterium]|nr:SLATT domain-containing protein [Actinomycetota bacterium]
MKGWTKETEALLREWATRTAIAKTAHFQLVELFRRRYTELGVPVVVLSSIVGTGLFATLSEDAVSRPLRALAGVISVLAAVVAGLQTFLRYGERAEKHMVAADWYAAVNRRINQLLALPPDQRPEAAKCLDDVRKEMARIGQQSPEIGQKRWDQIAADFGLAEVPGARTRRRRSAATEPA